MGDGLSLQSLARGGYKGKGKGKDAIRNGKGRLKAIDRPIIPLYHEWDNKTVKSITGCHLRIY
jgi:hypothetical protein